MIKDIWIANKICRSEFVREDSFDFLPLLKRLENIFLFKISVSEVYSSSMKIEVLEPLKGDVVEVIWDLSFWDYYFRFLSNCSLLIYNENRNKDVSEYLKNDTMNAVQLYLSNSLEDIPSLSLLLVELTLGQKEKSIMLYKKKGDVSEQEQKDHFVALSQKYPDYFFIERKGKGFNLDQYFLIAKLYALIHELTHVYINRNKGYLAENVDSLIEMCKQFKEGGMLSKAVDISNFPKTVPMHFLENDIDDIINQGMSSDFYEELACDRLALSLTFRIYRDITSEDLNEEEIAINFALAMNCFNQFQFMSKNVSIDLRNAYYQREGKCRREPLEKSFYRFCFCELCSRVYVLPQNGFFINDVYLIDKVHNFELFDFPRLYEFMLDLLLGFSYNVVMNMIKYAKEAEKVVANEEFMRLKKQHDFGFAQGSHYAYCKNREFWQIDG